MLAARRTPTDQLALTGRSQQRLDGQVENHEEADAESDSAPDSSLQDLRWGERSLFVLVLSEGPKEGSVEPGDRSRRDQGDEAECDEDDRHKPHEVEGRHQVTHEPLLTFAVPQYGGRVETRQASPDLSATLVALSAPAPIPTTQESRDSTVRDTPVEHPEAASARAIS